MKEANVRPEDLQWKCEACNRQMEIGPVTVSYMGHRFTVDLARCPGCADLYLPACRREYGP